MADEKPTLDLGIPEEQNVHDLDADSLLPRVESMARRWQNERAPQFARNERWYHNDQWSDHEHPDSPQFREWDRTLPKIDDNLLPNAAETMLARLLEMNPVAYLFPGWAAGASPTVARVGNRILEIYVVRLEWYRKLHDICRHALLGGTGGGKMYWHYTKGRTRDGEMRGDICFDPLTVLDFATDGAQDIKDAKIFYHTEMIDPHEAFVTLRRAGYSVEEAKAAAFSGDGYRQTENDHGDHELEGLLGVSSFGKTDKVRATEIWIKPCDFIPDGRFLSYVGSTVVENTEYIFDHGELPAGTIRWRPVTGSGHGSTPMDSMVKLQRAHNETLSIRSHRIYEGRNTWIWANPKASRQMRAGGSAFIDRHQGDDRKPEVITHEPRIDGLNLLIQDSEAAIDKAAGVPAFLNHGQDYNQRAIGKSMAYMNFATSMKSIRTLREVWSFTQRMFMQILELVQQHYELERLVSLLGPGSELDAEVFLQADLSEDEGYVVLPQVGHGDLLSRVARATEAQAAVAEGTIDPQRGTEMGQTGLGVTEEEHWNVQVIHEAAKRVLEGAEVVVPDEVDAGIAVRELRRLIPTYREARGVDGLEQMLQYFEDEMLQGPPPGAAPPQQGAPQPGLPGPQQQLLPPEEIT